MRFVQNNSLREIVEDAPSICERHSQRNDVGDRIRDSSRLNLNRFFGHCMRGLSAAPVPRFQFVHFIPNPFQSFLSQLMFHVGFVVALRTAPVRGVCKMDCLQLLAESRESGVAKGVIYCRILRAVTIRAKTGEKRATVRFSGHGLPF